MPKTKAWYGWPARPKRLAKALGSPSHGPALTAAYGESLATTSSLRPAGQARAPRCSRQVRAFVPLDLSEADLQGFLGDVLANEEQWAQLVAEIRAIADGAAVKKIGGDQVSRATFFFQSPIAELCDREVAFTCVGGEWRAEG